MERQTGATNIQAFTHLLLKIAYKKKKRAHMEKLNTLRERKGELKNDIIIMSMLFCVLLLIQNWFGTHA